MVSPTACAGGLSEGPCQWCLLRDLEVTARVETCSALSAVLVGWDPVSLTTRARVTIVVSVLTSLLAPQKPFVTFIAVGSVSSNREDSLNYGVGGRNHHHF
jgi:hypothetical protein